MNNSTGSGKGGEAVDNKLPPQPWYFHAIASFILIVHGFTFLVPQDPAEGEDASLTLSKWIGCPAESIRMIGPYAQVIYFFCLF